jgi:hypothetical protein
MYWQDYSSPNKSSNVYSYFLQNCYEENILRDRVPKLNIRNFAEGVARQFAILNLEAPTLPVSGARALTGHIKPFNSHIIKNILEVNGCS